MHLQLDSRPGITDVSADGLALRFSATPGLQVVGTLTGYLSAVGLTVVVEVLAASHRVHVLDDSGILVTEQIACVGSLPIEGLPGQVCHEVPGHRLEFRSERPDLDARALADLGSDLRSTAGDDGVLVVSFPGHRDALTSVRILDAGWETWHLYPGDRPHGVRTRTKLVAP